MEPSNTSVSFFTRGGDGVKILSADPILYEEATTIQEDDTKAVDVRSKVTAWSPDGMQLAMTDPDQGVIVIDLGENAGENAEATENTNGSAKNVRKVEGTSIHTIHLFFSPMSSTLVTVSQVVHKGDTGPNLQIWRRTPKDGCESGGGTGEWLNAANFTHPKLERDKKVLQWTSEETFCARLCPDGTVKIHDGADLAGAPLMDLQFDHAAETFEFASLSRVRAPLKARLCIFVPDVRDDMQRVVGPGELMIWEIVAAKQDKLEMQPEKRCTHLISSGQNAELQWNATGSALIALCTTEVDETGKSYYGGAQLVLASSDGQFLKNLTEDLDPQQTSNGNSVQAVSWSPTRDEFILIMGFQPAQVTLWSWDEKAQQTTLVKILVEKAHRNTIRFNSFGSLVLLAGFGNLAGDVEFFGRMEAEDDKCDFIKVADCTANCTVSSEWAPDGRHLLTAVLAPRMRVDNGFSIWKALTGTKVTEKMIEELNEVQWRPEPINSLRFLEISSEEVERASKELAARNIDQAAQPKKQAYRPPKARGDNANAVAAMMRGEAAVPATDDRRGRRPWQQRRDSDDPSGSPHLGPSEDPTRSPPRSSPRRERDSIDAGESQSPDKERPRTAPPSAPPSQPPPKAESVSPDKPTRTPPSQRPPPPPAPPPPGPVPPAPWAQEQGLVKEKHQREAAPAPRAPPSEAPTAPPPKQAFPTGPPPSQPPQQQQATPSGPPPTQPAPRKQQQREREAQQQAQREQQQQAQQGYPTGPPPHSRLAGGPTHEPPSAAPNARQQQQAQQSQQASAEAAAAAAAMQHYQRLGAHPGQSWPPTPQQLQGWDGMPTPQQLQMLRHQQAQLHAEGGQFPQRGPGHGPAAVDSAVIAAYGGAAAHAHQQAQAAQAAQLERYLVQQQQQQARQQADQRVQQQRAAQQAQQQAAQAAQAAAAAQATQAADKRGGGSCPASGWQYRDPKGNVQGPFTLLEMQLWHSMGYFRPELPMRFDGQEHFVEFNKLFPPPLVPFESVPRRVQQGAGMHGR